MKRNSPGLQAPVPSIKLQFWSIGTGSGRALTVIAEMLCEHRSGRAEKLAIVAEITCHLETKQSRTSGTGSQHHNVIWSIGTGSGRAPTVIAEMHCEHRSGRAEKLAIVAERTCHLETKQSRTSGTDSQFLPLVPNPQRRFRPCPHRHC